MVRLYKKLFRAEDQSSAEDHGMLVDAQSAAKLLKDKGVLASAQKHMTFYKVTLKRSNERASKEKGTESTRLLARAE